MRCSVGMIGPIFTTTIDDRLFSLETVGDRMELSIVSLGTVPEGGTATDAYDNTIKLAQRAEELGYSAKLSRAEDGRLIVTTTGVPGNAKLSVSLRRPLGQPEDRAMTFERLADETYTSTDTLPSGRWIARLAIEHGDTRWVEETELQ